MAKVELYTWANCPFCIQAKDLLDQKKIPYTEFNIDNNEKKRDELYKKTKQKTVPFVFINDELIGGYTELKNMDATGKLDFII
ncbi:MAG: glutaredoxin 3 [Firmicutes bacterium]|nr:glutaredoxin 3 [Bacillota bacterium]